MTIQIPPGGVSTALAAQIPGVVFASQFTPGWAYNAGGKDDTVALNAALNAARAITTLGNGVGEVWLDAATYFLSGPLNCFNVCLRGRNPGGTRLTLKSDWASALPCNAGFALDQQPSVALGAPTQNAPTQAAGSSAYTLNQVVSAWITASNSRNGGETIVSGRQVITISAAGGVPTFNWTAIGSVDSTTTYNVYLDRAGGTNPATAVRATSGQTGTSWADTTGTGGTIHPPTVDTTGGVGIMPTDMGHAGAAPVFGAEIAGLYVNGPGTSALGAVPAHVSGIRQGNTCVIRNVQTDGVFAGIYQNLDHEKVYNASLSGYYGVYRGGPAGDSGDQVFEDIQINGAKWAGFAVAAESSGFGGSTFRKVHIAASPFGFYKESVGPNYATLLAVACTFVQFQFESIGNGNFFCGGGNSSAVSNNTMNNCHSTNGFDPGVTIPTTTTDYLGVAIGRKNAPIDLNAGAFAGNRIMGGSSGDPSAMHSSATYVCGIQAQIQQGGEYDATAMISRLMTDAKPFTNANPPNADSSILYYNCVCRLYFAQGAISAGDLVQSGGGGQPGVAKSTGSAKPVGVALLAAASGKAVLVAHTGVVYVNSSTNTIAANATVIADPVNNGAVTSTGTVTPTNIVGAVMQGNSGGQTRVLLQGLI